MRELPLLVVGAPDAAAVDGLAEQPGRPAELVELRQRAEALQEVQDCSDGLGEVVAHRRAARHVHDRHTEHRAVVLPEEVHEAHRAGGVALRRGDAAPGRAGADGKHRRGVGRQPGDPLGGADRPQLAVRPPGLLTGRRPVAALHVRDRLVGDGALEDDDVRRVEGARDRLLSSLHVVRPGLHVEHGVVQRHAGDPGVRPQDHALDRGVGGAGDGDAAAVAAQAGEPEGVHVLQRPEAGGRSGHGRGLQEVLRGAAGRQPERSQVALVVELRHRAEQVEQLLRRRAEVARVRRRRVLCHGRPSG